MNLQFTGNRTFVEGQCDDLVTNEPAIEPRNQAVRSLIIQRVVPEARFI